MRKAEARDGEKTPLLVHTDLAVVNDQLEVMDPSYRHAVNGNWQRTDLHYELAQNTVCLLYTSRCV